MATQVVPMPLNRDSRCERSQISRLASMIPVTMRLTWVRRSRSTLYGQVSVCCFAVSAKWSLISSTASRLATSPDACPPMPSATMHSRSPSGSEIESSL